MCLFSQIMVHRFIAFALYWFQGAHTIFCSVTLDILNAQSSAHPT